MAPFVFSYKLWVDSSPVADTDMRSKRKSSAIKHVQTDSFPPSSTSSDNDETDKTDIDYWSRSFLALVYPVSITVVISALLAMFLYDLYIASTVFEDISIITSPNMSKRPSNFEIFWASLKIALVFLGVIAVGTCLLVLVVYCGFVKFLYGYLFMTVLMVFSLINISILSLIIAQFNCPVDWITVAFYVYNTSITAVLAMFWIAPNIIKKAVTIYQCVIMILYLLKMAPEWATWIILPLLAIWDMMAVLLPFGPLYLLIGLFQKRQIEVPAVMIYTTGAIYFNENKNINDNNDHTRASQSDDNILFGIQPSFVNLLFLPFTTVSRLNRLSTQSPLCLVQPKHHHFYSLKNFALFNNEKCLKRILSFYENYFITTEEKVFIKNENGNPKIIQNNNKNNDEEHQEMDGDNIQQRNIDTIEQLHEIILPINSDENRCKQKSGKTQMKKRKTRKSMLGLGDFVFYSVLLAKTVFTSNRNIFAVIAVYLSIIMGMLGTTIILVVLRRPLPALPISLIIGLCIFFQYHFIGDRFADSLRVPYGPVFI
ncbi:unnamed protein product [Didymodactylos carnosus]|uniref:Presenilin n=1 Tax=Didymodactylos carnosus TaxID=1234261 RepID=A0A813RDX8_9BILA|nr:unnamed protein product [Didymodactylos carnosus]CAF0807948.1 unnamed protein product [Didymodactylos carnosus]CAF3562785.1 unnamed protein product [Didymodactylos carnosus]CAF3591689.1 unnamed protein product [Didymodactylos carnosus]